MVLLGLFFGFVVDRAQEAPPEPHNQKIERPLAPAGEEIHGSTATEAATGPGAGRIVLDLSMGSFTVVPAPAGEPLRVDANFDRSRFELEESYEQHPDGSWTQKIRFGSKTRGFLIGNVDADDNQLTIHVPTGIRFALEADISMGESDFDLTGLGVASAEFDVSMGSHKVHFDAPSPARLSHFTIDGSMGEVSVRGLGWASPLEVDADHSMGELVVDLSGDWQGDAVIRTDSSMGPTRVDVPDNVELDDSGTTVAIGQKTSASRVAPPPGAPRLRLESSVSMGELEIRSISAATDPATEVELELTTTPEVPEPPTVP
jgi:hypothetical protein